MTQLMNSLFSFFLLFLVYSCTTVETVSPPPQQINVDTFKEQLKDLKKKTQLLEEEMNLLKNELSLVKKDFTEEINNDVLTDSERLAYQESFELIRRGDYEAAQIAFSNYIKSYQGSSFIDDAKFWLAESFYSQGNYIKALEIFENIQRQHPKSEKIMESILKSGFCYYELGNFEKSLTIFKQIITDYPNSSVSRLATEKLNTIR
jgi:tol-pal system protein YbgF